MSYYAPYVMLAWQTYQGNKESLYHYSYCRYFALQKLIQILNPIDA